MDVENEKDWRCGDGWYSLEMRSEGGWEDMWGSYHN